MAHQPQSCVWTVIHHHPASRPQTQQPGRLRLQEPHPHSAKVFKGQDRAPGCWIGCQGQQLRPSRDSSLHGDHRSCPLAGSLPSLCMRSHYHDFRGLVMPCWPKTSRSHVSQEVTHDCRLPEPSSSLPSKWRRIQSRGCQHQLVRLDGSSVWHSLPRFTRGPWLFERKT